MIVYCFLVIYLRDFTHSSSILTGYLYDIHPQQPNHEKKSSSTLFNNNFPTAIWHCPLILAFFLKIYIMIIGKMSFSNPYVYVPYVFLYDRLLTVTQTRRRSHGLDFDFEFLPPYEPTYDVKGKLISAA